MNIVAIFVAIFTSLVVVAPAAAVTINADGIVLINQAGAIAGNVSPGDTPGFPVTLSVSGSYRLTSTLTPPAGKNGIEANAAEVVIDMNGFKMSGGNVANHGIVGKQRGLSVRNGTIRAFLKDGIITVQGQLTVDNVTIDSNGLFAIEDRSPDGFARILNSRIVSNTTGIYCQRHCYVAGNTISGHNTNAAIDLPHGGMVLGNIITSNQLPIHGSFDDVTGVGNNTIDGNANPSANISIMNPNSCDPTC